MPRPATGRSCVSSPAGTSPPADRIAPTSPRMVTPMACRWAASQKAPAGKRPSSWSTRCAIPTGPTSTASRSSRAGSTRTARRRSASSTWRLRRTQDRPGRPLQDAGGQHGRRDERDLPQHHRRPALSAYWKDPAFDAKQRAFYYVRVIQIPSPRWTAYDQKRFGIKMAPTCR